jgi:hypothetical protein
MGPYAFCVVYQSPYEDGEVGIRCAADDAPSGSHRYRPGAMTDGYDIGCA